MTSRNESPSTKRSISLRTGSRGNWTGWGWGGWRRVGERSRKGPEQQKPHTDLQNPNKNLANTHSLQCSLSTFTSDSTISFERSEDKKALGGYSMTMVAKYFLSLKVAWFPP